MSFLFSQLVIILRDFKYKQGGNKSYCCPCKPPPPRKSLLSPPPTLFCSKVCHGRNSVQGTTKLCEDPLRYSNCRSRLKFSLKKGAQWQRAQIPTAGLQCNCMFEWLLHMCNCIASWGEGGSFFYYYLQTHTTILLSDQSCTLPS